MNDNVLNIKSLNVKYGNDSNQSLKNINLSIKEGECVAIIGESGCGKTSLLRSINGLAKYYYEAEVQGEILFKGKQVLDLQPNEISRNIGTLFQNPRSQFFNLDVSAELIFGCENLGMKKSEIYERVDSIIKKLNLYHLINKNIFELSGGEKQKVALASILTMNPSILLLDEVSSNLDMCEVGRIKEVLEELKNERKTIILSEHRMYWLKDIVDRYVLMEKGSIKHIFKKDDFLSLSENELKDMGIRPLSLRAYKKVKTQNLFKVSSDFFESTRKKEFKVCLNSLHSKMGVIGIIGKNGSGKSTFIEGILELTKKNGAIYIDGKEIKMEDCAYVMQDVTRQLFSETVNNEAALGNDCSEKEVYDILKQLNLSDSKEFHPQTLSGGQKQRLAIATSILSKKKICIMDEPTSGLDFRSMKNLAQIVKQLNLNGTLVIIITHDFEILDFCCDSIIEIEEGIAKTYEYDYEHLYSKLMSWYIKS